MYITVNDFTFQTIISWGTSQQKICVASIVQKPTQCRGKQFFLGFWGLLQEGHNFILQKKMPVLLAYVLLPLATF